MEFPDLQIIHDIWIHMNRLDAQVLILLNLVSCKNLLPFGWESGHGAGERWTCPSCSRGQHPEMPMARYQRFPAASFTKDVLIAADSVYYWDVTPPAVCSGKFPWSTCGIQLCSLRGRWEPAIGPRWKTVKDLRDFSSCENWGRNRQEIPILRQRTLKTLNIQDRSIQLGIGALWENHVVPGEIVGFNLWDDLHLEKVTCFMNN